MRIVVAPDPILRVACSPIEPSELKSLRSKAKQMAKLMYKSNGCGIAAPQVGISKRLMVVDVSAPRDGEEQLRDSDRDPVFFVNPRILSTGGECKVDDEGCLSIPGISVAIARNEKIAVEAEDLQGETFIIEAEGFYARAIQHELDHLDGTTMFEHLDPIKRIQVFKEYEEALRVGARPGDTKVT